MKNKNKIIYSFWILVFPISSYYFYRYVGFNEQICKGIYFSIFPVSLAMSFEKIKILKSDFLYVKPLGLLILIMLFSMLMAYIFREQSIFESYRVTAVYMSVIYFFLLMKVKPNLDYIEKIIWILCGVYIILWIYGLLMAPTLVFGIEKETGLDDSRGIFRLYIPGKGILVLSFFLSLNRYLETKNNKWIFVIIVLYIIIAMHVIRQVIFWTTILGLIYFLRNSKWMWFGLIMFLFTYILSPIIINEDSILGKLLFETKNQYTSQKLGDENIRITEYKYFFTEYSENIFQVIFGNGVAHSASPFGKMESTLAIRKSLFASDVGYAEIYIRFGLVGLILYGMIFFRCFKQKVPSRYMYAKLHMIYLLFANIAASWVFHDTIIICLSLYILEYSNLEIKIINTLEKRKIFNLHTSL